MLSLVATGRTNREISSTLMISEHTVARLQNILSKLGVSSRTAPRPSPTSTASTHQGVVRFDHPSATKMRDFSDDRPAAKPNFAS